MTYPSISTYCQALSAPKGAFTTLCDVCLMLDDNGEPIYRASGRSVRFSVTINGEARSLRLFTNMVDITSYKLCSGASYLRGELFVVGRDDCGRYYDVVVEPPLAACVPAEVPAEVHEDRVRCCRDGKWGFTNGDGCEVINTMYDAVDDFCEGRSTVKLDGLYGVIDRDGAIVVEPIYDDLSYDGSHLCYTELNGKWGVIDRMGRVIASNEWDWIGECSGEMMVVERDGKYGYIDLAGNVVIDIKYDNATSFDHNGYATVSIKGKEYQIDKDEYRV